MRQLGYRRAFTLVELLVVIAIIGILTAMVLPAIQSSREAGRRTQCLNNLRNTGLAFQRYAERTKCMPAASAYFYRTGGVSKTSEQGWAAQILPYMEEEALYRRIDFRTSWYSGTANQGVAATEIAMFQCPSVTDTETRVHFNAERNVTQARTDYTVFMRVRPEFYSSQSFPSGTVPTAGPNDADMGTPVGYLGGLHKTRDMPIAKYHDGLSKTLILTECAGRPNLYFEWGRYKEDDPNYDDGGCNNDRTKGNIVGSGWFDHENSNDMRGMSADGKSCPKPAVCVMNCTNNNEAFSFHTSGICTNLADGSTKFVSDSIDIYIFAAMLTRQGSENVTFPE